MVDVFPEECSMHFESDPKVFTKRIQNFLEQDAFVDVTLICSDGKIKAHRIVLAAFSSLFEDMLLDQNSQNSVIIFSDILQREMKALLEFIYKGSLDVPKTFMPDLLKAAKRLRIRGLEHEDNNDLQVNDSTPSPLSKEILSTSVPTVRGNLDEGVKVINPFAVKQRTVEDSDLTCVEEDLCLPGPSKIKNVKVTINSDVPNIPKEDDSDVEFIEENPAVVVVNDTQTEQTSNWFHHNSNKRSLRIRKSTDDSTSNDSEILANVSKKIKKSTTSDSDESNTTSKVTNSNAEKKAIREKTEVTNSNAKKKAIREKTGSALTEDDFMKKSFGMLSDYCVVCETLHKNIKEHIRHRHTLSLRRRKLVCQKCSKKFFVEYSLIHHKCVT